jgi:hypothetical protein
MSDASIRDDWRASNVRPTFGREQDSRAALLAPDEVPLRRSDLTSVRAWGGIREIVGAP